VSQQHSEYHRANGRKTSSTELPSVAEVVAAEIDELSIRMHLSRLLGASPAPLEGGAVTIAGRGSVAGRRVAAGNIKESFKKMGIPVRILESRGG
jgi:hypothetical protein